MAAVGGRSKGGTRAWAALVAVALLGAAGPVRAAPPTTAPAFVASPAALVDPFVGTGSGGPVVGDVDEFPGASLPFGMIQWSPDTPTRPDGGGYFYSDQATIGFSLTHLSGPGCPAYGDVPILPWVGSLGTDPQGLTAPLPHAHEVAHPGYYAAAVGDPAVQTALAVTLRTGIASFRFPATAEAHVLFKVGDSAVTPDDAFVQVSPPDRVTGWVRSGHFCGTPGTYTLYFAAEFDRPFARYGVWYGGLIEHGIGIAEGAGSGAWVTFDTRQDPTVLLKVGISYVSVADAEANLRAEDPGWSLDAVRAQATRVWNALLSRVQVAGGTPAEQELFYTMLYKALLDPTTFSDANGRYPGFDGRVHVAEGYTQYANFSGWDIYRSEVPLLALLDPTATSDMMRSLLADAQQGGCLPKWPFANDYTGVMNGDSADPILADAWAFGARGFDASEALADMVRGATTRCVGRGPWSWYVERPGLRAYETLGYVPGDASETLEYATDDFAIAELAQALGDRSLAATFFRRAQDWEQLVDVPAGALGARQADGAFPPGPAVQIAPGAFGQAGFQEGNAAQYTWMVTENPGGLVAALGGRRAAAAALDRLFQQLNVGPNEPYYWAGNEPGLGTPWLYDFVGEPWKTQAVVRRLITTVYGLDPGGEPGNDDLGAMSSWYVWAALGMYPLEPGNPILVLGSPLFPEVRLHLAGGTVTILGQGAAPDDPYVQNLTLDGRPWDRPWVPLADLQGGATLAFRLGPRPDPTWGAASPPPSVSSGEAPGIGWLDPWGRVVVAPGAQATLTLGVRNVTDRPLTVTWRVPAGSLWRATPSAGVLEVPPAGAKGSAEVTLHLAAPDRSGIQVLTPVLAVGGSRLPAPGVEVVVAPPGSLEAAFDNVGISSDAQPWAADFDGFGFSYSAEALAAAGFAPGARVRVDGVTFTWPDVAPGLPDDVVPAGQRIAVQAPPGTTRLGFLGAASNGPSSAFVTLVYRGGRQVQETLTFSDWTLNGGSAPGPVPGDQVAVSTPYRNAASGTPDRVATDVFFTEVPVDPHATLEAVILSPNPASGGTVHVFALAPARGGA